MCLERLYRRAKHYAVKHFSKVSHQDEFAQLPLDTLTKYLSDDSLVVQREEHVYEAAVRWLEVKDVNFVHDFYMF